MNHLNPPTFAELENGHKPTFIHLSSDRNGTIRLLAPDIEYEDSYSEQTNVALATIRALPVDNAGLNIERLNNFRAEIGATDKPIKFLESGSFQQALDTFRRKSSEPSGIYLHALHLALVRRDLALEALNGTAITESFAVHEAAHSAHIETPVRLIHTTKGRFFKKPDVAASDSRNGYIVTPLSEASRQTYGNYLEEGYAEVERGLYVQNHNLIEQFTTGATNYEQVKETPIPLRYFYKQPENEQDKAGVLTFAPGALAATVLSILMEHDDSLLTSLRQSRQNVDGLRKTAKSINNLMPGLYSELQHANGDTMLKLPGKVLRRFR